MKKILILALSSFFLSLNAQNVGIGTNNPDPSAKLDVQAVDGGILIPKIDIQSATDATTIPTPATGLMIWNTAATFGTAGFYFNAGTSVLPNWVKVLDSTSSLDDADADPANEHNTSVTLTGTTLNVIDGGGTKSQDLSSLQDHDWYESTGTTQADNISDDVYTNGNVGVRDNDPTVPLSVVGQIRASDAADETEYVEIDHGGSNAYINWTGDGDLDVRRDGTNIVKFEQDGDLSMQDDNSVKMPNNIVYREDWGTSTNYNHDQWNNVSGYTSYMTVESGNILKLQFNLSTRLESGSGTDDFYFRIFVDGTGGCADSYSEELYYRPMEDGSEHDNFHPVSYLDILPVSCDGTMRFRLQMNNTGDDEYEVRDRALVVTKF